MYLGTSFYIEPGDGTEVQELDYAGHSCVTVNCYTFEVFGSVLHMLSQ